MHAVVVIVAMPVVMSVTMVVPVVMVVVMSVLAFFRRAEIFPDEADAEDARDDRRNEADDRPDYRRYSSEKCVRDQYRIRARFRRGDEKRHAR